MEDAPDGRPQVRPSRGRPISGTAVMGGVLVALTAFFLAYGPGG